MSITATPTKYQSPRRITISAHAVIHLSVSVCTSVLLALAHGRWILSHFSVDPYLQDSGWLAYLFASGDPLLHNPRAINSLSFYAHHVSPHLFIFGAPLSILLNLDGFHIFAVHQAAFFTLFFISSAVLSSPGMAGRNWRWTLIATVLVGAFGNTLFQAAAYPHIEIAIVALAAFAIVCWRRGWWLAYLSCLGWLPLIREDGGYYIFVVAACCAVLRYGGKAGVRRRTLVVMAGIGICASILSFGIKAAYFPGFDAFRTNFSGAAWSHVTVAFVEERVRALLTNWNVIPVIVGSLLLSMKSWEYGLGILLLAPIYLLHLMAIRPEHGHFTLYFALPWLWPWMLWIALYSERSSSCVADASETIILLACSATLCAPVMWAFGSRQSYWYLGEWAFTRPVYNLSMMNRYVRTALQSESVAPERRCTSQGVAALVPGDLEPSRVIYRDPARCALLVLMKGETDYPALAGSAEASGLRPIARARNLEVWVK